MHWLEKCSEHIVLEIEEKKNSYKLLIIVAAVF